MYTCFSHESLSSVCVGWTKMLWLWEAELSFTPSRIPYIWHFLCKDFCAFQQPNNEIDFSFVQTNIASRVGMFLGSELNAP